MGDVAWRAGAVEMSRGREIRTALEEFEARLYVDLRTYEDYAGDGEARPTKKGLKLDVRYLDQLLAHLTTARAEAERRGWL
jgi:hypothetical protein